MRHGIFVAPFDELADPALLARLAADAEERGWDGFFLWDHIAYREPVRAVLDPWVTMGAMAHATERILLGPLVTPPARRRPAKLAREAATLDLLSGGRLVLGLGLGGDRSGELSGFGEETDDRRRAAMLDEALAVLDVCFSGEPRGFAGEHYVLPARPFLPARRPPIWLASRYPAKRPARRAARYEGWFPIELPGPDALGEMLEVVREARDPGAGPFDVVTTHAPGTDPAPWQAAGATWHLAGWSSQPRLAAVRDAIAAGPPR